MAGKCIFKILGGGGEFAPAGHFQIYMIRIERRKFNLVIKIFCFIYQKSQHLLVCFDEIFLTKNGYRVLQKSSSLSCHYCL